MTAGRRGRGDAGAYLVIYALLAVALFTLAALVLDVAAHRELRRSDRAAADLAATAGATDLVPSDSSTFASACRSAWGYLVANRRTEGPVSAPDCDGTFPSGVACDPAVAHTATGTAGALTVEITYPVPDSSPLLDAELEGGDQPQAVVAANDGVACQRVAVRVTDSHPYLFGGLAGIESGGVDVHAVARVGTASSTTEIPGIVSLQRTGCDGITTATGGGRLLVGGGGQAGAISADSDASACAGGYVIDPGDPGAIDVLPAGATPGTIHSYALGGPNFARAYDPADLGAGRLSPAPSPALRRTGRAMIDNRYNCTATCAAGSDHIDALVAQLGGPGTPPGYVPYLGSCTDAFSDPDVVLVGNVFVDCPLFEVGGNVTILSSSVVFAGSVHVDDRGCLAVNDASCGAAGVVLQDATLFLRGGDLSKEARGRLVLPRTFLYASGTVTVGEDGTFSGNSRLTWTAPYGGPFEDLLVWTPTTSPLLFGEQATTMLEGTVFAPSATVTLEGRPGAGVTLAAQVVADRVRLQGSTDVTLTPSPTRATGQTIRQVRLMR